MERPPRAVAMYLFAALMFLIAGIVGFLGETRATAAFVVLSVAFVILAINVWRSTDGSKDG